MSEDAILEAMAAQAKSDLEASDFSLSWMAEKLAEVTKELAIALADLHQMTLENQRLIEQLTEAENFIYAMQNKPNPMNFSPPDDDEHKIVHPPVTITEDQMMEQAERRLPRADPGGLY